MMNVSGPAPIVTVQRPDEGTLAMRLNQRFAAEVLQVTGDNVILSVEGVQLVARMTSMEQASQLIEHRFSQFVVKDMSESSVTIQLLSQGQNSGQTQAALAPDLIPNLLKYAGLPVNQETEMIARALLTNGLPVTPELVTELQNLLSQEQGWNQYTAHLAAALKAAGLPLSQGTLSLAQTDYPALFQMANSLQSQLQTLQHSGSLITRELAKDATELLRQILVVLKDNGEALKGDLQELFRILNTPIEKEIANLVQRGELHKALQADGKTLLTLAVLRRQLSQDASQSGLVKEIDRFLDATRLLQFLNTKPVSEPIHEAWLRMDVPLMMANPQVKGQENRKEYHSAHVRISYLPEKEVEQIDPANTHFVVNVDLDEKESIQINVSVAEKRVGMEVLTSTETTNAIAEDELPGLQEGIELLGYILQSVECETTKIEIESSLGSSSLWRSFGEVRVEA